MSTPGLALYDNALYDEVLYDEDIAFVQPGVPPDAAIFRVALGAPPQTFERMLREAVGRGNQKRVE
jgi:hypothetical protein